MYILTLPPGAWIVRPELTFLRSRDLCNSAEQAPARRDQSVLYWAAQCSHRHTLYWSYVTVSTQLTAGAPLVSDLHFISCPRNPASTWSPMNFHLCFMHVLHLLHHFNFKLQKTPLTRKLTNMFSGYSAHPLQRDGASE